MEQNNLLYNIHDLNASVSLAPA